MVVPVQEGTTSGYGVISLKPGQDSGFGFLGMPASAARKSMILKGPPAVTSSRIMVFIQKSFG